jgi:ATP-binding cassette subfamily D (ALD) protein 3
VVRTQLHSESIAALKGAAVEESIISRLFSKTMDLQRDVWSKLIRLQASYQIAFMVGMPWFLKIIAIGPGVFSNVPSRTRSSNVKSLADTTFRMSNAIQMSFGIGMLFYVFQVISQNTGTAARIMNMISVLKQLREKKRAEGSTSFKQAQFVEFTDVDIETPTQNRLVNNLSFKLGVGDSLLLTGHNGAGKSSIFRCLGGLWKIPSGTITKPGSAEGLNTAVFYIPQKPYQVLGTLADQLTYPTAPEGVEEQASLTEQVLREILEQVDLGYLLDRPGAMTEETNWEEELSLGEKQRVAIARLIYRKPEFAILDECTSAVSSEMEINLYRICEKLKVTYITISHR